MGPALPSFKQNEVSLLVLLFKNHPLCLLSLMLLYHPHVCLEKADLLEDVFLPSGVCDGKNQTFL